MSRNDLNQLTPIRQNKYWKTGPGRTGRGTWPGLDVQWNLNEQTAFNQTLANQLDEGPIPAAEVQGIASKYGVNKGRFWTKPVNCTGYLPMNMARAALQEQPKLRQAINYAIDRKAYVAAGRARTPVSRGATSSTRASPVGRTSAVSTKHRTSPRRRSWPGHIVKHGHQRLATAPPGTINPAQAQIVKRDLIRSASTTATST